MSELARRIPTWAADAPIAGDREASVPLRWEDVCQDGTMRATSLPIVFAPTAWAELAEHPLVEKLERTGVIPVLSRLVVLVGDGPISPVGSVSARANWGLAHVLAADGTVDRILLEMWASVTGRRGTAYPPFPPNTGAPISVGTVYAENVFTRPFAKAHDRKVKALEGLGVLHPGPERFAEPPERFATIPEDALDHWRKDLNPGQMRVSIDDTDANRHMNSLVYPSRAVGFAIDAFAAVGLSTKGALRWFDFRFDRPTFAGDVLTVHVRPYVWRQSRCALVIYRTSDGKVRAGGHLAFAG